MLEDGNNGAFASAQLYPGRLRRADDDYFYFDDATLFSDRDDSAPIEVEVGGGDAKLAELLELAGVLDLSHGGWLCEVGDDGTLEQVLARVGVAPLNEISRVIASVRGLINLSNAAQPFQWLSGGREYIVCAIGDRSVGRVVLFMRARASQVADWGRVRDAANRVQRMIHVAMSLGKPDDDRGPADEAAIPATALADLCPFGVIVVDLDQRVHLANAVARAQFAGSALIGCTADRLAIFNADDAVRFQVALRAVLMGSAKTAARQTLALVDGEAQPLLLHVARLPGPTARACVMITDPAASRQVNIQPLAQIFALTPVETRLVSQLVQGRNVQEAARALHLKVETVRTYLKQVFQKTGTHRQVELVQLMQNGALPALGAAA
ncbi:MAG TPA: PAS domain-containing protein [Novosphingobium sp.]